jgi:sugar lactone lactonase YvrE
MKPFPVLALCVAFAVVSSLSAAERLVLVAGGGDKEPNGVPAAEARLREPFGVEFDPQGRMVIVEMAKGNRVLRVDQAGRISHIAGKEQAGFSGDGGPLMSAQFNGPHNLAITPAGEILIGDTWNGRVRRLDLAADKVSSLPGYAVPLEKARSAGPYCITLDFSGTKLCIADLRHVHLLDLKTGRLTTIAGNGQKGIPADGAKAVEAPLVDPRAAAVDRRGNLYILERNGHALRVVDPQGRIRTVVNASGKKGATGDSGPALEATMNGPKHLCVDRDDTVLIADAENHLIRRYIPATGRIERVAGTGKQGRAGLGGPPAQAELARPHGVTIGPDGLLYITDSYNDRILKVTRQ